MVASEDVAKYEGELKVTKADGKISQVEIAEVELRIQQLERRRDRMKEVASFVHQVKDSFRHQAPAAPSNGKR